MSDEEEEEKKRPAPSMDDDDEPAEPQYEPYVDTSNAQDANDLATCHTISEEFSCEDPNALKLVNPPKEVLKMDEEVSEILIFLNHFQLIRKDKRIDGWSHCSLSRVQGKHPPVF